MKGLPGGELRKNEVCRVGDGVESIDGEGIAIGGLLEHQTTMKEEKGDERNEKKGVSGRPTEVMRVGEGFTKEMRSGYNASSPPS